jgi:hypothetical protein
MTLLIRILALALLVSFTACKPEIGDDCELSTDCAASGDRLCDTTQPAGYCTIFNCEPDTCPEESICVAFQSTPSSIDSCSDPQGTSRFIRSFCMRRCDENGDCRSGYRCYDMNRRDNPYNAVVMERGAQQGQVNGKVCAVPQSGTPLSDEATGGPAPGYDDGVCSVTDAGADAWASPAPELDAGSDAASDPADADLADAPGDAPDAGDAADGT